ncbi:activin receptor type-2B-like [Lingula anatina]|uniref:Activin receptor type-2B-like n=1 Tax=Lingula anatina TaxID=7574 RepID=A0A2R2MJT2_LINAN|nr:activin receptor type-2B-like [Lingula anatina]|eukprot:XP_023930458.1 activin receptor type-2B-like [Lingula anatina]
MLGAGEKFIFIYMATATTCEYYDSQVESFNTTEHCETPDTGKRVHCYASWKNTSLEFKLLKKGCWLDYSDCYGKEQCIENKDKPDKDVFFCCCDRDMCNTNISHVPLPTTPKPTD